MKKKIVSNYHVLVEGYVELSARRPLWVLGCLAVVTVLFAFGLPRLRLDTKIEALLPANTASQVSNREATERYAGSAPFFLVVQSSEAELNRRLAEEALREVKKWPETLWAMNARDPSFFLDRRLLFVNEPALADFTEKVKRYVAFQKCEKMPGCFQLDDEPEEPSFDELQESLKDQTEVKSLAALFSGDGLNEALSSAEAKGDESGRLCSPDGHVCVVQVTLNREPTDLEFAREMVARGEGLLDRLSPREAPSDLKTAVSGIYRNLPVSRAKLMGDLSRTFGLGALLMVGIIMLQFRRVRAIWLLLTPLLVGSVWALGVFAWLSPELNLISAAGFIILAGLGIDFGLHLLTHYGAQRELGHTPEKAVHDTLLELLSSLTVAAITTACGFCALVAAAFRGFAQLGLFATIGIFATLASAVLLFPPLVLGLQKLRPREGALTRAWKMPAFLRQGFGRPTAAIVTGVGALIFLGSIALVPRLSLRYDLTPLIDVADDGTDFRQALGGTSRGAVLLLADDRASLEEAADGIRKLYPNGLSEPPASQLPPEAETSGAPVITLGTFLPPDQEAKLKHVAELKKAADEAMRFGDEEWKDKLRPWLPLLDFRAGLTLEELPDWVRNSLTERDGTLGTVGLTYQDYPGEDAAKMLVLSQKLEHLRLEFPRVRFASPSAVLGEVMPLLREDGWRVTGLALLGTLIATLLIGRSRRRTLLILSAILLSVGSTAAVMAALDWRVDFYNMLVFPVAFGIGVDGAIYVVWTVLKRAGKFDWTHLPVSGRAVFGSTMTTWVMFLSLSTSDHGGLSSLGSVGSLALFVTLLANLLWLPAALSWLQQRLDDRGGESSHRPVEVTVESVAKTGGGQMR